MECYKIRDLSFCYPNETKEAVKNLSFDIMKGEFITVCGASGSGKTTLLRLLKPLISPEGELSGEIEFEGGNIKELSNHDQCAKIGFVMQDPDNQIVTDKVWHELSFGLESLGVDNNEIRTRVSEMTAFFGLDGLFNKNVNELSGGQKQLVNLASVMVMNPDVLILDEPTAQLDPVSAEDFLDAVLKINRELGTTVILSEHRLENAIPMSDRLMVMDEGEIIAFDKASNVQKILKEKSHHMLVAMTTAMRLYSSVESELDCPVSVRDGRKWLSEFDITETNDISEEKNYNLKEKIIEIKDLYFRYDKNSEDIIKNLSLDIYKGEIFSILGANGSGKSTLLSIISGINIPHRGKILVNKENIKDINLFDGLMGVLCQNPKSMFAKNSLYLDYMDMLSDTKTEDTQKKAKIKSVAKRLGILHLINRHPNDLSGGELQRAAIGKLLLKTPSILLLDEPTKGMDANFKRQFASILCDIKKSGTTVIMVSHDVEFCAEYSDRCALMFDGAVTSVGSAQSFFKKNIFYTTACVRITRGITKETVLVKDAIKLLKGKEEKCNNTKYAYESIIRLEQKTEKKKSKPSYIRIVFGILFACIFFYMNSRVDASGYEIGDSLMQMLTIFLAGISVFLFLPQKRKEVPIIQKENKKLSKRTITATFITLILIPLTILFGVYKLNDRKYYFISLMIILEIMLPFFVLFEGKKSSVRELIIISVLCAMAVAGRIAFYAVPQFKPILAIIIIAGVCFGAESGFLVGSLSAFVSNFYFLHGVWTPWQMFGFGIVGFVAGILFSKGVIKSNRISLSVFGFIASVIIYGGIMDPASVLMMNPYPEWNVIVSSWVMGFHLNVVLGVSTAFFLYFLSDPMIEIIGRIKTKYNIL